MDKKRGLRAKNNGIEIRYSYKAQRYSYFFNKPWNPTNCLEASRLRLQLIEQAKLTITNARLKKENPYFYELAQDYLDYSKSEHKPSTVDTKRQYLNSTWLPALGHLRIKDITIQDVRLADKKHDWKGKGTQRRGVRHILSGVFQLAIEYDYIDFNPCTKFKPIKTQKPLIDPFSPEEKEAILAQMTGQTHLFYLLAFECGLRTGEIMGLERKDFRNGYVSITKSIVKGKESSTKTGASRQVLLTQRVLNAFKAAPTNIQGWMWINPIRGNKALYAPNSFNNKWKIALEAANVRFRRAYNTRHTYASIGLSAGADPQWLADQLGHDIRTFFTHYATYRNQNINASQQAKILAFENSSKGNFRGENQD
jgi:integrase